MQIFAIADEEFLLNFSMKPDNWVLYYPKKPIQWQTTALHTNTFLEKKESHSFTYDRLEVNKILFSVKS